MNYIESFFTRINEKYTTAVSRLLVLSIASVLLAVASAVLSLLFKPLFFVTLISGIGAGLAILFVAILWVDEVA